MRIAIIFSLLLGLGATLAAQVACGATSPVQADKAAAAQADRTVEKESAQLPAPSIEPSQADSAQPLVSPRDMAEPQEEVVEVGYKKGMHVPEFGLSLLDGTRVTSAKLVEEGKPIFVFFHATW